MNPTLLLLSLSATTSFALRYENLVLEGGGFKGLSYIGALKALKQYGYYVDDRYAFRNISGTSVGCLFGLFVALDIDPERLESLAYRTNFVELLDADDTADDLLFDFPRFSDYTIVGCARFAVRAVRYTIRVVKLWLSSKSPGLVSGTSLISWLMNKVVPLSRHRIDPDITMNEFATLTNHDLTCYVTRLIDTELIRYNAEQSPNARLFDALYASISLPIVFKPLLDEHGRPLVDGGLLDNFPIYAYDHHDEKSRVTLGLSLHAAATTTKTTIVNERVSSVSYIKHLISTMINGQPFFAYATDPRNRDRVVYLNSPLRSLDYDMTRSRVHDAIERAYRETVRFLEG